MIGRKVNLNPNTGNWDEYTRKELLDSWRRNYYENNVNMSPIEGYPQGGNGYFDSQLYASSLDINEIKNISPTDDSHPVNIAFEKRKEELDLEFNSSCPADKERLSNLIEVEKDSHDYWQKNEIFSKVLNDDNNGNPYPKELVDEIRSERKISEDNLRVSMEDLINYDAKYDHPLSYPNRNLNEYPITDSEREKWCNRESEQGIKREYQYEGRNDNENKILEQRKEDDYLSFVGKSQSFNSSRVPEIAQKSHDNYTQSFEHKREIDHSQIGLSSNQKVNRVEGQSANLLENKINEHNKKEIEGTVTGIENSSTLEKRDERIQAAQEKVKEVIPQNSNNSFKEMPEIGKEKSFFSAWVDKTKEKVSEFKEKAVGLWENRVAPKIGIETEKSRKEAHQQVIDKINRKEIHDFERNNKIKEDNINIRNESKVNDKISPDKNISKDNTLVNNEEGINKNKPVGQPELNQNINKQNIEESYKNKEKPTENIQEELVKKRRPSSGINDDVESHQQKSTIKNDDSEIKNKPAGESSKQEFNQNKIDEDFTKKIK